MRIVFGYPPSVAWRRLVLPWFSVRDCWLALVGLRCLGVPRSCGVHDLRDGATCLRSGLCSSSVRDRVVAFPSFWWVWFLAFVRGPLPQAGAVFFGMSSLGSVGAHDLQAVPPSHRLVLLLRIGFLFSGPGWGGKLQPFPSPMYSFGMWSPFRSIVFLSLLIANEGLHWWWLLWLVATLFTGLSLCFASGLSSPGLLCCLAMSLRYADLLYLWLCAYSLLDQGVRGLLACPLPSSLLWFCKSWWVLFSPMVHALCDGVTPAGSMLVCPRSERRFSHHMGQVYWSVCSFARPTVVVGAAPFLLKVGLRTSV